MFWLKKAVQPRGYGEHGLQVLVADTHGGSAPWIRGTLKEIQQYLYKYRFSPVDTGNTSSGLSLLSSLPVQPRGYGEHSSGGNYADLVDGSAPWIRGTLINLLHLYLIPRFSPVDTGNTSIGSTTFVSSSVQPRGYGEHLFLLTKYRMKLGSAPWIRGTHVAVSGSDAFKRFSPVDTGNTISCCFLISDNAVQPRGYGEHPNATTFSSSPDGSAPWIRGTRAIFPSPKTD